MQSTLQDVQIVPISEAHVESFYQCLEVVARERSYLAFTQAPPLEATREFVLSNIANEVPQFVAVLSRQVIGWCDISPKRLEGFKHCGHLGMGILKPYRRLGLGRQLMTCTLEKAKAIGLERIELEVFASNLPAIRFYEKMGFVTEGIKRKVRKLDGYYDDNVQMALFL